tara:strand:+ start:76 stop:258 length:183 start_codon:yes stop_codon:yes gene_type:complete
MSGIKYLLNGNRNFLNCGGKIIQYIFTQHPEVGLGLVMAKAIYPTGGYVDGQIDRSIWAH